MKSLELLAEVPETLELRTQLIVEVVNTYTIYTKHYGLR